MGVSNPEAPALGDSIKTISKALAAAVVTALVGYVSRKGINLDVSTQEALRILLDAFLGGLIVWLIPNKSL